MGKIGVKFRILSQWLYRDKAWLKFKEIREGTGIPERNLARYLKELVEDDKVLEKDERGYRPRSKSFDEPLLDSLRLKKSI